MTHPCAANPPPQHLGVTQTPSVVATRVHRACIPQYTLGHRGRLRRLHAALHAARTDPAAAGARLTVVGAAYHGVGVNDLVLAASRIARGIGAGAGHTGLETLGGP
jgi:protoporphyrinogen oxidase